MLYALCIDILYKQQINRTFIERDKKLINKKIKKRLSNQQMNQNIKIDPYGFREYDARWLYEKDINSEGITNLGKGLGTQIKIHTQKSNPRVIVGHDYRSYSEEIKIALKKGLISTGCCIEDIGLSLSPMVYFAQFNLDADAVAMITASHNENGWTGVKMGIKKGLTHAPE